ncbi:MAG: hypothetical protein SFY92_02600 [Verrucomicrobiae bacterium]|nr:hypothetical protein [Verrucomicrobiae bacterium]
MTRCLLLLLLLLGLAPAPVLRAQTDQDHRLILEEKRMLEKDLDRDVPPNPSIAGTFRVGDIKRLYLDRNLDQGPVDTNERAVFQDQLAQNRPAQYGQRFYIHWVADTKEALPGITLRLELRGLRGSQPTRKTVDMAFPKKLRKMSQSTKFDLIGEEYQALGEIVSWRVQMLAPDGEVLAKQQSFMWKQ